jgi:hypothetical protein
MSIHPRTLELALSLYDARRSLGHSEGRALYATAAGLAAHCDVTRDAARDLLMVALQERAKIPTRTDTGAL